MASIRCELNGTFVGEKGRKGQENDDDLLQHVPAKIGYSGEEHVKTYFTDFIKAETEDGDDVDMESGGKATDVLTTALRGRPLKGCQVDIPEGYNALVLQTGRSHGGSLGERTEAAQMRVVQKLDKITAWNYDSDPTNPGGNTVSRALQWIQLAKVLHSED